MEEVEVAGEEEDVQIVNQPADKTGADSASRSRRFMDDLRFMANGRKSSAPAAGSTRQTAGACLLYTSDAADDM
eukprot:10944000-Alexandrium_andersonii.AAC.1